jgi:DNA repair photolyase
MQAIYTPTGKALEYCERAVNLYRGCEHRCRYCYAPNALHMPREEFARPQPRPGILDAVRKDAPKHTGREVLMCFTCDPYQPSANGTTREAILALQAAGCRVTILTKGGERSAPDLEILRPGLDKYGATLTFADPAQSLEWEPGAAPPEERIAVLRRAKARGISTWASLEPVIDPEQSLALIERTAGIVDKYKLGKWNHDARAKAIDWRDYAAKAVALIKKIGADYMVKVDLAAYLGRAGE